MLTISSNKLPFRRTSICLTKKGFRINWIYPLPPTHGVTYIQMIIWIYSTPPTYEIRRQTRQKWGGGCDKVYWSRLYLSNTRIGFISECLLKSWFKDLQYSNLLSDLERSLGHLLASDTSNMYKPDPSSGHQCSPVPSPEQQPLQAGKKWHKHKHVTKLTKIFLQWHFFSAFYLSKVTFYQEQNEEIKKLTFTGWKITLSSR